MTSLTGVVGTYEWKEASKGWHIYAIVPTLYRQDVTESITSNAWSRPDERITPSHSPTNNGEDKSD